LTTAASDSSDKISESNRDLVGREVVVRRRKLRPNTESTASDVSVDSLASVNSILSDESSVKTYRSQRPILNFAPRGKL
jgi:hypothetical protein